VKTKRCYICGRERKKDELLKLPYDHNRSVYACPDHDGVQELAEKTTAEKKK
jgi:predicted RNA-binding protein YlxR (DUF448 family)